MIPIVTPDEMNAIDTAAPQSVDELIARAGWAVAQRARVMLGGTYGKRIVLIAGKGNNGADGRIAAQLLRQRGVRVQIIAPDSSRVPRCDLVIDAAYGTGLTRTYRAPEREDPLAPVLAVDIPSGLSGLTGQALGAPYPATETVTFAALKPGLLVGAGPDLSGHITIADIGLDTTAAKAWLVERCDVRAWLPARSPNAHKWQSAVRLVAGSPGMTGAATLATMAALRAGSGYVRRTSPGSPSQITEPIEAVTTTFTSDRWADELKSDLVRFGALAIGPGLGLNADTLDQVAQTLGSPIPIVLDGDGLRALGSDPALVLAQRPRGAPLVVLTPHEGEFTRIFGSIDPTADRFEMVRDAARVTGAVVLLKGSTTIVAHPNGHLFVTTTGDSRLATAGTGDVLTGTIAAFLARGMDPLRAAAGAAWVHGAAGRIGPTTGLIASELPGQIQRVLSEIGEDGSDAMIEEINGDQ